MTAAWRPLWGYYLLMLKLTRVMWFINVFMGVLVPVMVYAIYAQHLPADARTRLLVGNVLFSALMMVARGPANEMVFARVSGVRELLATAGLTRTTYMAGNALFALTLAGMPVAVLVLCVLFTSVPLPVTWLWIPPFALALAALVTSAFVMAAMATSLPTVSLLGNLLVAASLALCPLLYPVERVPAAIRPLVAVLPPTLSAESMTAAWEGHPLVWWHLPLLCLWTAGFALFSWRRFPWTDTP